MQENLLRLCYDGDPACRVHHTVGRAEDYALMSQLHYDTTLNLLLFLRGHGEIRIEGRLYSFGEGDMIILNPSELHRTTIADDTVFERISLHIGENLFKSFGVDGPSVFRAFYERPRGIGNIIRADRLRELPYFSSRFWRSELLLPFCPATSTMTVKQTSATRQQYCNILKARRLNASRTRSTSTATARSTPRTPSTYSKI